jgi:cell division protein FtsB
MTSHDRRVYWWGAAGLAVLFLVGNQGFRELISSLRERHRVQKALAGLRAEHDRLTGELNRIQHDPSYTEYLIRKHLGYVRKGEVEYRLMKVPAKPENKE